MNLKKLLVLLVILFVYSALVLFLKPLAVSFLKNKMEHAVAGGTVTGDTLELFYSPWSLLCQNAIGVVFIKDFKRDKVRAHDIKAVLRWQGGRIYADSLSAQVFNGKLTGTGIVKLGKPLKYTFALIFSQLDLGRFVQEFELKDKMLLAGALNGRVTISGTGGRFSVLNGEFDSPVTGGDLTINDTRFLEAMAARSKLPPNLIVDSFKNYHYNDGLVRMFLNHGDLVFNMTLKGGTGLRRLQVVLHDFKIN